MNYNWIFLALLSTLTTGIGVVGLKLIDNSKYDNIIFLALTFMFMGILTFFYLFFNQNVTKNLINTCDINLLFFVILYSIFLLFNNLIVQYTFKFSPNIGYSHIIINLNVIITLFAAYYLFKQKFDFRCLIGIIIALIGISIIAYYSNKK
jgi:drug/metabolite transporter (DMT)-like permease